MPEPILRSSLHPVLAACVFAALAFGTGCPPPPPDETPDAGEVRPDACNSLDEALTLPECALTLGEKKQAYLSFATDQDWYSFTTPSNANARTLIHVSGGYPVANTAVNLSFNVLRADGSSSLVRKSDRHGQAKPQPIDVILPFAEANQRLVILVSDDPVNPQRPSFDVRAQYELSVDVQQDPDVNEPNDMQATEIALTAMGGNQVGTQTGYLATADDVDTFSIAGGGAKKVLYLHITGPSLNPPPPYRLSYVLTDAEGTIVSDGTMANELIPVDLATARLATKPPYLLTVKGHLPGDVTPVPGDLRLQYTVEVRIVDEDDPGEGPGQNDTAETAKALALSATGQTATQVGRLGYAGDQDWYRVDVPANSAPTVLHFKVTPGTGPARFPRLPGFDDRELRVLLPVQTGGNPDDDKVACRDDPAVCPRSFGNDPQLGGLHRELCEADTPRCLYALRREHPEFDALRNFEGTIPVAPHGSTVSYLVQVQDQGNNFADDTDYTLSVEWRADPDDAARWSGSAEQPQAFTLAEDPSAAAYPHPPSGGSYELTGRLSHGYGYFRDHDPNDGDGVRGPADYDAVTSDRDRYEITLPALDPLAGPLDRTWELEWEVQHGSNGGAPYDLVLELEFCDGDNLTSGGQCTPVKVGSRGGPLTLSYTGGDRNAWHNPEAPHSQRQPVYERDTSGGVTTVTAAAYGCFCFEPRFIKGGKFYVTVFGVDRSSWADLPYTVRMAYTDYPQTYSAKDGGTAVSCPAPIFPLPDAGTEDAGTMMPSGCWFTREP